MPLGRSKDDDASGAPVLNILQARVKLFDVEEKSEPFTVTRKSDGASFTLDPQFKCTVEVLDDGRDGTDNGAKFFEKFAYKQDKNGAWVNKENSKLGMLTNVVKPGYFEDESIPALTEDDLEGFEMICRVKPKKNPSTGQTVGSTIDWETMSPVPERKVSAVSEGEAEDDLEDEMMPDWSDLES